MKIYVAHSAGFDFKKELYEPIKNSDLVKENKLIFPHDGDIEDSKEVIKNSDLIVAEVSHPSMGEGIELGWADSFGKKIICLYKTGSKISTSLDYLKSDKLEYSDSVHLVSLLESIIRP